MPEETPMEYEDEDDTLDGSDLAGLSEYSATGGGGQPLHVPVLDAAHGHVDEPDVPDASSFRELYRYSLGRATQDAHEDEEQDEDWIEGGPLHVLDRSKH